MKRLERLGWLERLIRGWLPLNPMTVADRHFDWRAAFMVGAGAFFFAVGVVFLRLEQILKGPVTYVNCLPGMSCEGIIYNTTPLMPPFLVAFGVLVICIGIYYHRRRHSS